MLCKGTSQVVSIKVQVCVETLLLRSASSLRQPSVTHGSHTMAKKKKAAKKKAAKKTAKKR